MQAYLCKVSLAKHSYFECFSTSDPRVWEVQSCLLSRLQFGNVEGGSQVKRGVCSAHLPGVSSFLLLRQLSGFLRL